jgi:hypothetical protein
VFLEATPVADDNIDSPDARLLPFLGRQRILRLSWVRSARLGWTIDERFCDSPIYLARRVAIPLQWAASSVTVAPLFCPLLAGLSQWIPSGPSEYALEALPFEIESKSKYLAESECLIAAFVVLIF